MIKTKSELKNCILSEKNNYYDSKDYFELLITSDVHLKIYKYVKLLRFTEYHHNNSGLYHKIMYALYRRRKNKLGIKLGIEIWDNTFDTGLTIYHAGNIVINGMSKIGKNCKLHGSNCIGNSGKSLECPIVGDNVRLGVGAKVIGDVTLADNITVAAGAVVVDSFLDEGAVIGGVPARIIKRTNKSLGG